MIKVKVQLHLFAGCHQPGVCSLCACEAWVSSLCLPTPRLQQQMRGMVLEAAWDCTYSLRTRLSCSFIFQGSDLAVPTCFSGACDEMSWLLIRSAQCFQHS